MLNYKKKKKLLQIKKIPKKNLVKAIKKNKLNLII